MIYRKRVKKSGFGYTNTGNFHKFELGKHVLYIAHWSRAYGEWADKIENISHYPKFRGAYPNTWEGRMVSVTDTPDNVKVKHIIR